MQDKYFINGDGPYTWKNVLCWCYENINKHRYNYWNNNKINHWRDINNFFHEFRHNPNDGIYRKGRWEQKRIGIEYFDIVGPLRPSEERTYRKYIYENVWVPESFTPKRNQVTDSYGRIIPSSLIKSEYLKYNPKEEDRIEAPRRRRSLSRWFNNHNYEFRRDPVPNKGGYRNGRWHKYQGDHGYLGNEVRSTCGLISDMKDIKEECNITVKYRRKRYADIWLSYTDWDYPHYSGYKGWKRTRKQKQWM